MAFRIQQHVKKDKTVRILIQIFHVFLDKFTPKLLTNRSKTTHPTHPQVCKNGSFCSICNKLSENYEMQNSPRRKQGLLAAQMVKYQRL